MIRTRQYLRFQVGRQWYGIPIEHVIEVMYLMFLNELPSMAPEILGLITVHDEVLPVIDLRLCFGVKQPVYKLDTPIIATRTAQGTVGLVVDDAETVELVEETETVHQTGSGLPYVRGAVKLAQGLLVLIDPEQLFAKP
jgi:purine-binding chemotaxis protein CheW